MIDAVGLNRNLIQFFEHSEFKKRLGAKMADDALTRMPCKNCGKKIGVRSNQFGRRLRCPACQTTFKVELPVTAISNPEPIQKQTQNPTRPSEQDDEVMADEAGELVSVGPPRRAAATARFNQSPTIVFEATTYAIRRAGGEVLNLDRVNLHVRFTAGTGYNANEHTVFVFPGPTNGSELDIRASSPGGRSDELLYSRIASELAAYLEAHHAHSLAKAQPASIQNYVEPSPVIKRRKRRTKSADGFGIGGLVVSIIGLVFFCFPIIAVPLGVVGVVLSLIALTQKKEGKGLAIAGLAIGVVSVAVSGLIFLVFLNAELRQEERRRNNFGFNDVHDIKFVLDPKNVGA